MPFCPDCGAAVRTGDRHCRSCGYTLGDGKQSEHRPAAANGAGWGHSRATDPGWGNQQRHHEPDWHRRPDRPRGQQDSQQSPQGQTRQQNRQRQKPAPKRGVSVERSKMLYSLRFPFSAGPRALAYGTLWQSVGELLIPILPVLVVGGYTARLSKAAAWGDRVQPGFGDFGELLKEGFFHSLLGLVWIATVLLIGAVTFVSFSLFDELAGEPVTSAVLVVGAVALLCCVYLGPAMLTLPAVSGRPSFGLSPRLVHEFAFTRKYLRSFLHYLLLCGLLVVGFLAVIGAGLWAVFDGPLGLGILLFLVAFVLFFVLQAYFSYFSGAFWGATYHEAVTEEVVTDRRPPQDSPQQRRGSGRY